MAGYTALRVEHGVYNSLSHKIDYSLYAVQGQRVTDLNWETIQTGNYELCVDYARSIWEMTRGYFQVYNPIGYSYEWSNAIRE